MGKEKYIKKIEQLFEKSPVVDYASITRIIRNQKKVKQYEKQIVHYLLKKGKIKRLAKGYYTRQEDPSLAVFCFQPAYLGLQDALSFHNLWEQETIPVIITARKIRPGIREILGENVLIRRMEKKYFFGEEYHLQGTIAVPYSDIEKSFLDMVYFKEKLSSDVLNELKRRVNQKKLKKYLRKYPRTFRRKILSLLKVRFK